MNEARKIVWNYQNINFYWVLHLRRKYQNTNTMSIHIALVGLSVYSKYNLSILIMISKMQNEKVNDTWIFWLQLPEQHINLHLNYKYTYFQSSGS